MSLSPYDTHTWLDTVWDALHDYRENNIPEGDAANDEKWDDICTAMAWTKEALLDEGLDE